MKKIVIILSLLFMGGLVNSATAQVSVNVNININRQPDWGPIGYDYVEFYYFPAINIYYDIMNGLFYYKARNTWVSSRYLPADYRKYDLYGMYKIIINHQPRPWLDNRAHRRLYSMYKNDRTQTAIRYSNDNRYSVSRSNNVRWVQPIQQNNHPYNNNNNVTTGSKQQNSNQSTTSNNGTTSKRQSPTQRNTSNTNSNTSKRR